MSHCNTTPATCRDLGVVYEQLLILLGVRDSFTCDVPYLVFPSRFGQNKQSPCVVQNIKTQ